MVEFISDSGDIWVGNFAKGWISGLNAIHCELGAKAIVVVAGGAGYIIDVNERRLVRDLFGNIQDILFVAEFGAIIVSNGFWLEAFNAHQIIWKSRRFSWDGIRHIACSGVIVTGEAFDPMSDKWFPFRVDLSSGEVEGGSYTGPSM